MSTPWHMLTRAGPVTFSEEVTLHDTEGDLPLTVRWPQEGAARGTVVFCHGLGSSRAAYGELTEVWAAHGYVVIQPTFPDSINVVAAENPGLGLDPGADLSGWTANPGLRAAMHAVLHDPDYWLHRVRIVRRIMGCLPDILRQARGTARGLPCAIAGHSFGAYTAQLFAGAEIDLPGQGATRFRDDRFSAALVLSGQGLDQQGLRNGSWDGLTGPVLTVTGTKDGGAKGQDWHWKCEPYEFSPAGDKYLVVLEGGDHYLGGFTPGEEGITEQKEAVRGVTLAFLDAYLAGDMRAQNWLRLVEDRIGTAGVLFKSK
ncbi:Predicted dienelactone hydrolase [Lutimaribacter pacificus]|uniref:Predicted dienelactone hydrolase n=1 Tax=Lutimaribacter pacificus TaxID=391948 RepID=A0A1H0N7V7_9RHOB|nr:hypothetical protein [Lutimaribacter pacificus]SDO88420.1 Predicted dienelactone hydrolase [Lutimaribacter pacificus]SHK86399.1 Predicted dienelactone hydrolase [Lutimaribacter pacificus]